MPFLPDGNHRYLARPGLAAGRLAVAGRGGRAGDGAIDGDVRACGVVGGLGPGQELRNMIVMREKPSWLNMPSSIARVFRSASAASPLVRAAVAIF
jgi:hypothetical protein